LTIFSYTIDLNTLVDLLLVPVCLVLAALAVGITADRLIRRYINRHLAVEENTWKYVLIRSMQGIPIFFSFIIGLYWAIDAVEISPTLTKLLSYLLFTCSVFCIMRVIARTVDGVVTMYFERSGNNLPKTTLLNSILIGIIYAIGILVILQYYGISITPILTASAAWRSRSPCRKPSPTSSRDSTSSSQSSSASATTFVSVRGRKAASRISHGALPPSFPSAQATPL